jgi:hypothetical protein
VVFGKRKNKEKKKKTKVDRKEKKKKKQEKSKTIDHVTLVFGEKQRREKKASCNSM